MRKVELSAEVEDGIDLDLRRRGRADRRDQSCARRVLRIAWPRRPRCSRRARRRRRRSRRGSGALRCAGESRVFTWRLAHRESRPQRLRSTAASGPTQSAHRAAFTAPLSAKPFRPTSESRTGSPSKGRERARKSAQMPHTPEARPPDTPGTPLPSLLTALTSSPHRNLATAS